MRWLCWEGYEAGPLAAAMSAAAGCPIEGSAHLSDHLAARQAETERGAWDMININTPFVRDRLHPAGLIAPLDTRHADRLAAIEGPYRRCAAAAIGHDGQPLGVPQRFGAFNLVINSARLSKAMAETIGFQLPLLPDFRGRFGILAYDDFNVMHIALGAGLDPFAACDAAALAQFDTVARDWHRHAALVTTDHHRLNMALVDGRIDFYLSGGTYTASPARRAGRREIVAVTPRRDPAGRPGGIAFVEVNALLDHPALPRAAGLACLDFIGSADGAIAAALAADACNPVVQMSDPTVFRRLSPADLDAMQFDDLAEDLAHCADYALIPDYPTLLERLHAARSAAP